VGSWLGLDDDFQPQIWYLHADPWKHGPAETSPSHACKALVLLLRVGLEQRVLLAAREATCGLESPQQDHLSPNAGYGRLVASLWWLQVPLSQPPRAAWLRLRSLASI